MYSPVASLTTLIPRAAPTMPVTAPFVSGKKVGNRGKRAADSTRSQAR
jgi:hypothetical protein